MLRGARFHAFAVVLVFSSLIGILAVAPVPGVLGQAPGPVQDAVNETQNTTAPDRSALLHISVTALQTIAELEEKGTHSFPLRVQDRSVEGAQFTASRIAVTCTHSISNETPIERGWAVQTPFIPPIARQETYETEIAVVAGPRASPDQINIDVVCNAGSPMNREISNFTLIAHVKPYVYMQLDNVGVLPTLRPDQQFTHQMQLTNGGNDVTTFVGKVLAPEGWVVSIPDSVTLGAGESTLINITGVTPREKMLYLSDSSLISVSYHPMGEEGRVREKQFVAQINGLYLHPAILPIVVLAAVILSSVVFLGVLARRAIEEQILGKPVPPWRIPVEREYLAQLEKDDPDQFYIVRYYLMVEEHESALLWFAAFKKATKKDRKRETKWYKVKKKQERKVGAVEKDHAKLEKKWERAFAVVDKKRDRKIRRLEKKLRRKERKERRLVGRKHKKRVKKIEKKHAKKVNKATKKHEKLLAKETKKVERQNKKLEKKGEEPLPMPESPAPDLGEPELPELKEIEETPIEESRYAKRADRRRDRAEKKKEKLRLRREKQVSKSRLRADAKIEKLRAKIPPEPETHLYDTDEYIPDDQAIIEDDRPIVAKLLHIPTLEEREQIRRRRAVYQARLKEAKASGDPAQVEEAKRRFSEEMEAMKQQRRDDAAVNRAGDEEAARLRKEKKRQAKLRAKEAPQEPAAAEPEPSNASEPKKIRAGVPFRLPGKKSEAGPVEPGQETPQEVTETTNGEDGAKPKGLKARFQRRKSESSADSEEANKEPTASTEEAAAPGSREE